MRESKKRARKDAVQRHGLSAEAISKIRDEFDREVIMRPEYYEAKGGGRNTPNESPPFFHFLRWATSPSIGKYGEILFSCVMSAAGFECKRVNAGGFDFLVESIGPVDVKVVRHLGKKSGSEFRRYSTARQVEGVSYAYLIFWSDGIRLTVETCGREIFSTVIAQNDAVMALSNISSELVAYEDEGRVKSVSDAKRQLRDWVSATWGINARVIQRGDRARNSAMEQRGWGADNFYERNPSKYRLVVLLLVDGTHVYGLWAYPTSAIEEIPWEPKAIGPNMTKIFTFQPSKLPVRFKFESIDDFKEQFPRRFDILK